MRRLAVFAWLVAAVMSGCGTLSDTSTPPPPLGTPTLVINLPEGALDTSTPTPTMTPTVTGTPTPSATPTEPCTPKASFVEDVTVPDGSPMSPGSLFTKIWRVKNTGDCAWNETFTVVQASGTALRAEVPSTPLPFVAPGASIDVGLNVNLSLETALGAEQRAVFELHDPVGVRFANLTVRVTVTEGTPSSPLDSNVAAGSQSISGVVWSDFCHPSTGSGDPEQGRCVPNSAGGKQADGVRQNVEAGIPGVVVNLSGGACPGGAVADNSTITGPVGDYIFTNLGPGSYCIWVDSLDLANGPILVPGEWSVVIGLYNDNSGRAEATVIIAAGEAGTTVNFGWDYQLD